MRSRLQPEPPLHLFADQGVPPSEVLAIKDALGGWSPLSIDPQLGLLRVEFAPRSLLSLGVAAGYRPEIRQQEHQYQVPGVPPVILHPNHADIAGKDFRWSGSLLPAPVNTGIGSLPLDPVVRHLGQPITISAMAVPEPFVSFSEALPVYQCFFLAEGSGLAPGTTIAARLARGEWHETPGPWFPLDAAVEELQGSVPRETVLGPGSVVEMDVRMVTTTQVTETVVLRDVGEVLRDGTIRARPGLFVVSDRGWKVALAFVGADGDSTAAHPTRSETRVWRDGEPRPVAVTLRPAGGDVGSYVSSVRIPGMGSAADLNSLLAALRPGPIGDVELTLTHTLYELHPIQRVRLRIEPVRP